MQAPPSPTLTDPSSLQHNGRTDGVSRKLLTGPRRQGQILKRKRLKGETGQSTRQDRRPRFARRINVDLQSLHTGLQCPLNHPRRLRPKSKAKVPCCPLLELPAQEPEPAGSKKNTPPYLGHKVPSMGGKKIEQQKSQSSQ